MSSLEKNHRSSETKHLIIAVNGGSVITTYNNNHDDDLNMENNMMVDEIPVRYTSLREVLPAEIRRRSSEEDIQIRNPLVKQAALAYLSPMSTPLPQYEPYWWLKKLFSFNNGGGSNNGSHYCAKSFDHKKHYDKVGCIDFLNVIVFGAIDDDRYDQCSNDQR